MIQSGDEVNVSKMKSGWATLISDKIDLGGVNVGGIDGTTISKGDGNVTISWVK